MTDLALQYTKDLESNEGRQILNELSKFADKIEDALDFDNAMWNIQSLSESEFYKSSLLRREVSKINEDAAALELPAEMGAEGEIESVINNSGSLPTSSDSGILGMLKGLLNTLTEGGSPIGILQLILDFVGLVGDAFLVVGIPLGMVADFVNAIIYFFRKKWVLGIISLIATIPFGGDVAKGFKGVAHTFSKPFSKLFTKGSGKAMAKESAEVLMKQEGKIFGKSKRFLEYLKKSAAKIAANISSAIAFLLENVLGKAIGWVPFIGKPLRKFLTRIADLGRTVADNLLGFAKHADGAISKEIAERAAKNFKLMEETLEAGGKVIKEGDNLIIKKGGKVIKEIPIDDLATFSNISKKFPDGPMKAVLKNADDVADFYTFISKNGNKARKFLQVNRDVKIARGLYFGKLTNFIARQVVKLLGPTTNALSDYEKEGISDIVTTREINDRMKEHIDNEMKRKGSKYDAPYIDTFLEDNPDTELKEDELAMDLQKHLNYNAKLVGLPSFQTYLYAQAKNEKEKEIEKYYIDHAISPEKYKEVMGIEGSGAKSFESVQYSSQMKYIKPFKL